jgi:hypothetical protein
LHGRLLLSYLQACQLMVVLPCLGLRSAHLALVVALAMLATVAWMHLLLQH